MTNITFNRKEFEKTLGMKVSKEIEEKISLFGTPLESLTNEEIEVEIFPDRPDLISMQGFIRGFKAFLGKEKGLKLYTLNKPLPEFKVKVDPSVKNVRPYTVCAIVKNLSFNDEKIKEIIDLQEKLHITIGRNRKKAAIGVYPLEKIKLPIKYTAKKPSEIRFIPLETNREMNASQILKRHPAGRTYADLLKDQSVYPIFIDSNNNILSMPPIINSQETGKITHSTKDVFIECSGHDSKTLQKIMNIIVTTLADMGGKIYQMSIDYGKNKTLTPDLTPEKLKVSLENTNKLLGTELKEKDISLLLSKMGHDYNQKNKTVQIPAWRTDILHEVDLIEDIAIAYGYENFRPKMPDVATIGRESQKSKFKSKISEILTGLGLTEISSYHLIKESEAKKNRLKPHEKIEVENSKTEYKILRPDLLTSALRILTENKDNDYPQNIFEIGSVFRMDEKQETETGIIEKTNLIIALTPGSFTQIKQHLDYLFKAIGLSCKLSESQHQGLIDGRTGTISMDKTNKEIGYMGEVHPETLRNWNLKMPLAIIELNLDEVFERLD